MASETRTFSESWYRVAGQRVALRPHVQVRRQFFRDERYYVVHDPINNQFFRLRPAAYEFVARLRLDRTIEEVWRECLEAMPDDAPGQDDALRLLGQLYQANLLRSNLPPDSGQLFDRYEKRREREVRSTWLNLMYARFPIFDPDAFLKSLEPLLRRVISPVGAAIWLLVVGWAAKIVVENVGALRDQSLGVLGPGNLFLLFGGMILIKTVHEFGHASACRRLGGEVHVMGIMLMIFTPVPYVDTTSSWAFRSRWHRAFVGAAGMIAELFVAALATFIWAGSESGVWNALAYNMMFIASVSTVLFNINPLLRFDGYYILSDLIEIPNLQMRAQQQLTHLAEYWLFGRAESRSPANSSREVIWLTVFGLASLSYRVLLFSAIIWFVASRFLIVGVIMALICAFSWLVLPIWRLFKYLAVNPRLERQRSRAVIVCLAIALVLFVVLRFVPAPNSFRAPGVVEAVENRLVNTETDGRMIELLAIPGTRVSTGQELVKLENRELELELMEAQAEVEIVRARRAMAQSAAIEELRAIDGHLAAAEKRFARLRQTEAALTIHAPHDGLWLADDLHQYMGTWIARGTELGQVINPGAFRFSAVVSESEASRLFAGEIRSAEVRLRGDAGHALLVGQRLFIPGEQKLLPSAALGWQAGGDVAMANGGGLQTREPFFAVRAMLGPAVPGPEVLNGRSGIIRFELAPAPLLEQWWRRLQQVFQKRFPLG